MKHLRKFNEELHSDTFRRASYKLKKLGHLDRSKDLMDWSNKRAGEEAKVKWEENLKEFGKFGTFKLCVTNPETNESVTGDFHLDITFDEMGFQETYREDGAGIWFMIGIIPKTWELKEQCADIASDDDFSNGFFWGMNFGLKFDYNGANGGSVVFGDYYLGNYDEYILGNVKMVDRGSAGRFKILMKNIFTDPNLNYPSGYTNAATIYEVLERNFNGVPGFSMSLVADQISKVSPNNLSGGN